MFTYQPYLPAPADQCERSRQAAERYALTEHLRRPRAAPLRTARRHLAAWIAPRDLQLTPRGV